MQNILSFDYESDLRGSYLVLTLDTDENIIKHQIEMLQNNTIPYIIPFDLRQVDSNLQIYYKITSRQTLAHVLQRISLTKTQYINFLKDIINAVTESSNYFLYDNSYLLQSEYIYV